MHSFTSDMRMIHSKVADKDTKTTIIKVGSLGQKKIQFKWLPETTKEKQKCNSRGGRLVSIFTANRFQITTIFK